MTDNKKKKKEDVRFPSFAVTGGMVALIIFLGAFLVTSRANTPHPQTNLHIPIPQVPDYPDVSPRAIPLSIFDDNNTSSAAVPVFDEALEASETSIPTETIEPQPSFTPDFESSAASEL